MKIYKKIKGKVHKPFVALLVKISPQLAAKYLYQKRTGRKLNLNTPHNFNEKINWLNLYWQHPLISKCGDKYEVRDYVKKMNCAELLIDLYAVYEDVLEIDWDVLPQKFALKVTNGCGYNIICEDKNKLNKNKTEKKLNKWMKTNDSLKMAELHYGKMKPRITIEKFLETKDGSLPVDYKLFCFNGQPTMILVATERAKGVKRFMFDLDWNKIDFIKPSRLNEDESIENIEKPTCFNEMIDYAKKLAKPFPFVRIDFYNYEDKPILGEMTFTPDAGSAPWYKEDILLKMGEMIKLPERILRK